MRQKQRMCEYGSCRVEWDAKGTRGCGSKRYCDEHRPLVRKATAARYYQRNKESYKERQTNWNNSNSELVKEMQLNYREKNREKLRIKARADYQKNKVQRVKKYQVSDKERYASYYIKNKERIKARRRARYAEKKSLLRGTSKDTQ